ncbi:MAG: UBP-type zinc finger domain-containing protein [Thaumarchaeota archaeon]|nr:UBP-type zinc finger domain-containing protein [Nitrososphaerota archaeon]
MSKPYEHILQIKDDVSPKSDVCEECHKTGKEWVSLRMCLSYGHIGCDRTPNRHAEKHFRKTGHPLITDLPDRKRRWCYMDNSYF